VPLVLDAVALVAEHALFEDPAGRFGVEAADSGRVSSASLPVPATVCNFASGASRTAP
jgi:hypothetical protein